MKAGTKAVARNKELLITLDLQLGGLMKASEELKGRANTPYMLGHWRKREHILRDYRRVKKEAWSCVEQINQLKSTKA